MRESAENMKPSPISFASSSSLCGYSERASTQPSRSAVSVAFSFAIESGSLKARSAKLVVSPGRTQQRRKNSESSDE